MKASVLLCLMLLLLTGPAVARSERGRLLLQVYNTQELGGSPFNESLIGLPDGRIAVANGGGVLLFDGARWTMSYHPDTLGGANRLARAPDGSLHSGFNGDVGSFADDGTGTLVWHSLRDRLPPDDRTLGALLAVDYDTTRQGTWYLFSARLLFVPADGTEIQVRANEGVGSFAGFVGREYWVQDAVGGLQRVAGHAPLLLEPVPGREILGEGKYIRSIVADGNEWKVAMADGRLYSYRDGAFLPWAEPLWPMLASSHVMCLLRLGDGRIVVGAAEHGPLILDAGGLLVDRYERVDGIPPQPTKGMFEDRLGGLWLAQQQTLVRIDLARGVSLFDESRGLPSAYALSRWQGDIFVAAGYGLFRLSGEGEGGNAFERVLPELRNAKSLARVDGDTLLVASTGVHALSVDGAGTLQSRELFEAPQVFNLIASRFVPGRSWVSQPGRVARIDQTRPGEFSVTAVEGLTWPVYSIAEQDADTLWVSDRGGGVWQVDVAGNHAPRQIGPGQGVPAGVTRLYPKRGAGVWFTTNEGLREFDEAAGRLVAPAGVPAEVLDRRMFSLLEDEDGNLWVRGDELTDVALKGPDGYRWDRNSLAAVSTMPTVYDFVREGSVVWVLRADGVVRIDLAARRDLAAPLLPVLTHVDDLGTRQPLALASVGALPETVRNVRLRFALPGVFPPEQTRYRSRLAGIDPDWSDWSQESMRDYTNLPDGGFRFEVEARDVFGRVTSLAPITLSIAPPWTRTRWAYGSYLAGAALALWLASLLGGRVRHRAMRARQRELEATVGERTAELAESNRELGDKNRQLADQAQRLIEVDRLKTRFFVNVGHEFRTPLTLVLGPIEDLLRDASVRLSGRVREQLELAHRNARRVLELIVEILDVNRLEHGHLPIRRERIALGSLLQQALGAARPLAERHGHTLSLTAPPDTTIEVDADPAQLERCVSNLIGNAAKFMSRGGRIEVALDRADGAARVSVRDYGRGIATAAQAHVFDRFFQTEGDDEASGYGVGLALVREIVEAHDGRIAVQSTLGEGSTFTICLPLASGVPVTSAVSAAATPPPDAAAVEGEAAPGAPDVTPASATRDRPLLLVVDDHDDLRARLRHLFEGSYEVAEAADGPSAWRAATERLPDVIVCDVMMPGFDGIELTRRIRAHAETASISLLLLTAKAGTEHAVTGLRAGANDYLEKPFDSSELLARVEGLLAQTRRLRHQLAREARPVPDATPAQETPDQRWRRRLDAAIDAGLDDSLFGVDALARAIHGDRSTLFRKCKQLVGMNPSEYLRERRLARGRELLQRAAGNVSEVAYAVGFESQSSFSHAFAARYGEPPSAVLGARQAQAR